MLCAAGLHSAALSGAGCLAFLAAESKPKKGSARPAGRHIQSTTETEFSRRYQLGGEVTGSGHPGMAVLFATRLSDSLPVVIKSRAKSCSFPNYSHELIWRHTMESLLNVPKSDTICELFEVIETAESYYVVMERINGKDLFDIVSEEGIGHVKARTIVRQIFAALAQMHGSGRIHKDIKMENVMITQNLRSASNSSLSTACSFQMFPSPSSTHESEKGNSTCGTVTVKIIDFDTVEDWEPGNPRAQLVSGTSGYIAPEAYNGNYSPASDVYCVGVIMYELLTDRMPLDENLFDVRPGENVVGGPAIRQMFNLLRRQKIDFAHPAFVDCPEAACLCESLLAFEADQRPSAAQAMEHPWFELPVERLPH